MKVIEVIYLRHLAIVEKPAINLCSVFSSKSFLWDNLVLIFTFQRSSFRKVQIVRFNNFIGHGASINSYKSKYLAKSMNEKIMM